jgi:hypothetical protein
MTIHITVAGYLAAQARVVQAKGDGYSYPSALRDVDGSCQYVVDGTPACIAGATLAELGVPVEAIHALEGNPVTHVLRYLTVEGVVTTDERVGDIAYAAQEVQDVDTSLTYFAHQDNTWEAAHAASVRLSQL